MTTLVFGTVGALVGGAVGGSIGASLGWTLGAMIGNLIDPPKVEGPRRSDLKLQVSEYGKPIPIVWGLGRLAGNVIDQTDLIEHKQKSGGKGGPEVTSYTYSASFAILLCEGPIKGVRRIWADGKLIWAQADGTTIPCTLYLGTETQDPDPTFEAIHGVGNQPAYRGMAYVVFADYMLTDFGDRIPMLEFEVYTAESDIPWRVNSFRPWENGSINNYILSNGSLYEGLIVATEMTNTGSSQLIRRFWDYSGNQIGDTMYFDTGTAVRCVVYNSSVFLTFDNHGDGTGTAFWWRYIPEEDTFRAVTRWDFSGSINEVAERACRSGDYIYLMGHQATSTYLYVVPYNDGAPGEINFAGGVFVWDDVPGNFTMMANNLDDSIYLMTETDVGNDVRMWHFDHDLNIIRFWDVSALAGTYLGQMNIINSYVWNQYIIVATTEGTTGGGIDVHNIRLVRINDDYSIENYGSYIEHDNTLSNYIGNGLFMDSVGIYSLIPPPATVLLSDVVADLSDKTDLDGAYDVSELTDEVRWYAVANQMTVRNALEPLRKGFMFDAVESDDLVKFRKRGATDSVVTISDDDLVAREYGSASGDPLTTVRKKEKGMPRTVTLKYIDVEADYQTGAQSSPRLTTRSDQDTTLDLAIGWTATEALQRCWTLQVSEWIEREGFAWDTGFEYDWVEPCDVVTVRGRVVRVTKSTRSPKGFISWEGVLHRPSIYTQEQTGAGSSGFIPQENVTPIPGSGVGTFLVLMDMPLVLPGDAPYGFYAAAGPTTIGPWPGYILYKSVDGGLNYTAIATVDAPDVIGVTATAVGSPPVGSPSIYGVLSSYGGGETVEEASICVVLRDDDAELFSTSNEGLANGANLCAVSRGYTAGSPATMQWEILQFRTAEQIDERTYILSGFKRGRRGTGTSGHASGDSFVLLPVTNINAPAQELNVPLLYKAVTFGHAIADVYPVSFTNTGLGAESYFNEIGSGIPVFTGDIGSPSAPAQGGVPAPAVGDSALFKFLHASGAWLPVAPPWGSYLVRSADGILQNESVLAAGSRITFTDGGGSPPTSLTISANMQAILIAPTFNATQTIDLTSYANYHTVIVDITVTNDFTFNITNGFDGQLVRVRFKQDGTGARIFTAGANLRFSTSTPSPVLTVTPNKIDRLAFEWHGADSKADMVAINKAY